MRTVLPGLVALLLSAALPCSAEELIGSSPPPQEEWDGGSGGSNLPSRHETLHALPYGEGLSSSYIVSAALAMPQVQTAIQALLGQGCLRRSDLDVGLSQPYGSTAAIAFQFPGVDPRDRQPYILVVTRVDEYRFFTQVMTTSTRTGPGDTPALDESVSLHAYVAPADATGEQLQWPVGPTNPVVWSTAYDIKNNDFPSDQTLSYVWQATDCFRTAMGDLMTRMAISAAGGAVAGARGGPGGAAWGGAVAAGTQAAMWFHDHSNPCP